MSYTDDKPKTFNSFPSNYVNPRDKVISRALLYIYIYRLIIFYFLSLDRFFLVNRIFYDCIFAVKVMTINHKNNNQMPACEFCIRKVSKRQKTYRSSRLFQQSEFIRKIIFNETLKCV